MKKQFLLLIAPLLPLFASDGGYPYASIGGLVGTASGVPFPVPQVSGFQADIGKRTFFGRHGWDLAAGYGGNLRSHNWHAQTSYLYYPKAHKDLYFGAGLGLQAGSKWDEIFIEGTLPLTLGYEFKRSFLQAQMQPVLFPFESHFKTRALSLAIGFKI